MPLIRVKGFVADQIIETVIPVVRPIVKFHNGYIRLVNNQEYIPYYEFTKVPIIEVDLNDEEQDYDEFDEKIAVAMAYWDTVNRRSRKQWIGLERR